MNDCRKPEGVEYSWEIMTNDGWYFYGSDTFKTPEEAFEYVEDKEYLVGREMRLVKTERTFITREKLEHEKIMKRIEEKSHWGIQEMQG